MAGLVLVVDDDLDIRETLWLLLTDSGYQVVIADSGQAALVALRASTQPMVVLLDLLMPEMSGIEVLETIRADSSLAAQHAYILMTADSRMQADTNPMLFDALAVDLLYKPFDLEVILDVVAQAECRLPCP